MKDEQQKLDDYWNDEFEARDERTKKEISEAENEQFKAAFSSDHPDYIPKQKTKDEIMYDGMTREEWWETKKRVYPENKLRIKRKSFDFTGKTKKTNLVHNQILGYQPQEVIDYALENQLIIKKKLNGIEYYCIPTEKVSTDKGEGFIVSHKYREFKAKLDSGQLKIKKEKLL